MIKDIFFIIILFGVGVFSFLSAKADSEYNSFALLMSAPFFLASFLLFLKHLPNTNIIKQFTNKIHLGAIIFVSIFVVASIFLFKKIINSEAIDWITVVIFLTFLFAIGQILYKQIIKK